MDSVSHYPSIRITCYNNNRRSRIIFMGFNSYKIRDGKHIPSEKFKNNWHDIWGKKKIEKKNPEQKEEEEKYLEELKNKI